MSGHRNWEELRREFTPDDLAKMAKWSERLRIATRLFAEADLEVIARQRHRQAELRAASMILMQGDELAQEEHVRLWIESLMRLHNIEGNL